MAGRTSIVNISGEYEETATQLGRHLGRDKLRRKIFNAIYGRGIKPRSKKQIMEAAGIQANAAQQAQNAVDHLWKHNLILRTENDGSVQDGSRYLYGKDETVRAIRPQIVKFADDRKAADRVPTNRRPIVRGFTAIKSVTRRAMKKKKKLNVLYLTANPDTAHSLRVDAEVRQVQDSVQRSVYRDNISLEYRPAADLKSLIHGLNDHRPRIVHFSGHGYDGGIAVDHPKVAKRPVKTVSFELLAKALAATDEPPDVIVLNSCKSAGARKSFLPPAKAIIVMRDSISDLAAINFAVAFYAAIAAGQSVKSAFAQGRVAVENSSLSEAGTPDLVVAAGVDPSKLVLL
jgi:hypothetical protein